MFKAQLLSIMKNSQKLYHMIDESDELEDWVQSKITLAEDYLQAVYGYIAYQNGGDDVEMGDDWDDEDGWDDIDEEDWDDESYEDDGMDIGTDDFDGALDSEVEDDELFESKKKK